MLCGAGVALSQTSKSAAGAVADGVLLVGLGLMTLSMLASPFAAQLGLPASTSVQGTVQREQLKVERVSSGGDIWLEGGRRIPAIITKSSKPEVEGELEVDCLSAPRLCSLTRLESAEDIEELLVVGGFVGFL